MSAPPSPSEPGFEVPRREDSDSASVPPLVLHLASSREAEAPDWTALEFDFEVPPEPIAWAVDGLLPLGGIGILSGDTGSCKTWLAMDLVVAATESRSWLGRDVTVGRVMVIDGENSEVVVKARLRALGMTNDARERLTYFCGQDILVGSASIAERLDDVIAQAAPDLFIVDTVMAATAVADANDNNEVVALYGYLKRLARKHNLTVLLLHHERKTQAGQSRSPAMSMMGGRQWAGQVDSHLAVALRPSESTEDTNDDGTVTSRTVLRLDQPKNRYAVPIRAERVVVEATRDGWSLQHADVRADGKLDQEPTTVNRALTRIVDVLRDAAGPLKKKHLAERLDLKPDDRSFERALTAGVEHGRLCKPRQGEYALGPEALTDSDAPAL